MTESHFNGSANRTIVLDDVQCTGSEATLLNCSHSPLGSHDCSLSEAAGVLCGTAEGIYHYNIIIRMHSYSVAGIHASIPKPWHVQVTQAVIMNK